MDRIKSIVEISMYRSKASDRCVVKLIPKGMVYSPAYGYLAFPVSLFDEFISRAVPELYAT